MSKMRSHGAFAGVVLAGASVALMLARGAAALSPELEHDLDSSLQAWYGAVGEPRSGESFGSYLARAALVQRGRPYDTELPPPGREELRIRLDRFECVSFLETSLAVARCGWRRSPSTSCFVEEVEASRYRGGERRGYDSRLHYFVDWIQDNETRGRLRDLTKDRGGVPVRRDFFYISRRQMPRAEVDDAERQRVREELARTERRLSDKEHSMLTRESAPIVLEGLEDGDIVAVVRERPGLLVHHAGFVFRAEGAPRLLHASSYHERVVLTIEDISDYLLRRPEREGVLVARPVAP